MALSLMAGVVLGMADTGCGHKSVRQYNGEQYCPG